MVSLSLCLSNGWHHNIQLLNPSASGYEILIPVYFQSRICDYTLLCGLVGQQVGWSIHHNPELQAAFALLTLPSRVTLVPCIQLCFVSTLSIDNNRNPLLTTKICRSLGIHRRVKLYHLVFWMAEVQSKYLLNTRVNFPTFTCPWCLCDSNILNQNIIEPNS